MLPMAKVLESPSLLMNCTIQFVTLHFGWSVVYLGNNCIQSFHLGRYIVGYGIRSIIGYAVRNLVLRPGIRGDVKPDF